MQTRSKPVSPTNRNIERRTIALGVVGFLVLTALFFSLAFFYVGPRMRSPVKQGSSFSSAPSYIPPQLSRRSPMTRADEDVPAIDLEVIEHTSEPADQELESGEPDTVDHVGRDEPHSGRERTGEGASPTSEGPPILRERVSVTSTGGPERKEPSPARARVFRVQVGTFVRQSNAERLVSDLQGKGFKANVAVVQVEDHTLYRVQLGQFKTRDDALGLANDLTAVGYAPAIITQRE